MSGVLAVLAGAVGLLVGWFGVLPASGWALRRARMRTDEWWDDSIQAYGAFKKAHPDLEPEKRAKGLEGALAIWQSEAASTAAAGALTQEKLASLEQVGFKTKGLLNCGTEAERTRRFSVQPSFAHRALWAAVFSALSVASGQVVLQGASWVAFIASAFAMSVAVVCDLRARTIPLEACGALAVTGAAFQFSTHGLFGVESGVLFAILVVSVSMAANRLFAFRHPRGVVGGGDLRCMGSLALATGPGAVCGFAVCYALAACAALLGCATKRLSWDAGMPMAPFLSAWLVFGSAASTLMF